MFNHKTRFRGLDGWRGIAVTLVFLHHYLPEQGLHGLKMIGSVGWQGVDLFFTLSGFLITGVLLDTLNAPGYFKNFYGRRALRLMPVYLLVVALILLFARPLQFPLLLRDIPFFAYGANIVNNMYGTPQGPNMQLGHFWSLAVEEQFYFLWPPLVLLLKTSRRVLFAALLGIVLSTALCWLIPMLGTHYLPYEELPTRLAGLLAGAALAAIGRIPALAARIKPGWMNLQLLAGLLLIGLAFHLSHTAFWTGFWTVRIGYFASAVAFFALIALAVTQNTWAERLGKNRVLSLLGRYSYGFYLFHQIPGPAVRQLIAYLQLKTSSLFVGGMLACTIVYAVMLGLAMLSYHLLELPCLKLKRYFAYKDERKDHLLRVDQSVAETVGS